MNSRHIPATAMLGDRPENAQRSDLCISADRPRPANRATRRRRRPVGERRRTLKHARCIAYEEPTGARCARPVGKRPCPEYLALCQTHAKRVWLALRSEALGATERFNLSKHPWRHIREVAS